MQMPEEIPTSMLAPCGIPCAFSSVHLRKKKSCLGCRGQDSAKPGHCQTCKIKACAVGQGLDYCFQCQRFPCTLLKRLDKSYRLRYQVSIVAAGVRAREAGPSVHLAEERQRWSCPTCGGAISLHDRVCSMCGLKTASE